MLNVHPQQSAVNECTATAADRVFRFNGLSGVDFHIRLALRHDAQEPYTHIHLFAHTDEGTLSEVGKLPATADCTALLEELFQSPPSMFLDELLEPFLMRVCRRINGRVVLIKPTALTTQR